MSHQVRHALIMAAGRGRRMMPLTDEIPKPMAPFEDSTLIGTGIARLREHIANIHVTVGYKGAMLAQHLIEHGVATIINTDGRENAWWIYHTLIGELDEPLFVLTCDNVTDIDFDALALDYDRQGRPPCMLVGVEPVEGLAGDYIFEEEHVVTKVDRNAPSPVYCSGIQVLNPGAIRRSTIDEGDFYSVWRQLIARGELRVSTVRPKMWFSVDTLADLARARSQGRTPR